MNTNQKTPPQTTVPLRELLTLIIPIFKQYRLRIAAGLTALLGVDLLQLLVPRVVKQGVDGLAERSLDQNMLLQLAGLIILLGLIVAVLRFTWRYLIIGFSRILEKKLRDQIVAHILKMEAPFFERYTTGDLMAHSSNDMTSIQMACGMGLVAATDAFLLSAAAIAFMMYINPGLTLIALLPMPFLAICTRILSGQLHRRFTTVQEQFSLLTEFVRSALVSIRLLKANTMENFQNLRFDALGQRYVRANLKVALVQGLIVPIATLAGGLGMLLVLYFGGRLVITETITIGDFAAFISYLAMLVWPMMAMGWVINLIQRGRTSLQRIYKVIESQPALPQGQHCPETAASEARLAIRDLTFCYPSATTPALQEITTTFGPGLHGITGRAGSGKSTLCRLLTRLYPVADGTILFNKCDVNLLPPSYLRAQLSYVSQEPVLFSSSIAENIALGNPEASGGQKQRLALARALLCETPLLIIDDGLSAVDVATEHAILEKLGQNFSTKTVLIVSNRVKLLSMAQRILVFEEGRIIHDASHKELITQSTLYRSMYEKQMRNEEEAPV